jgi:hypothetical protein
MATFTAKGPALAAAVGAFTEIAWGVDATAGTSATITVPQFGVVKAAGVWNAQSAATLPFTDTPSGNTFKITKGSGDVVVWVAFGTARI